MFYNYHSIFAGSWQIVIQLTMWKSRLWKLIWKLVRFIFFTIVYGCWVRYYLFNTWYWWVLVIQVLHFSVYVCWILSRTIVLNLCFSCSCAKYYCLIHDTLVILVLQILYFSLLYMSAEFWYYCKSLLPPVITVYSLTSILEEISVYSSWRCFIRKYLSLSLQY